MENKKIKVHSCKGVTYVDPSEICYCKAERSYSRIFLLSGKSILICKPLNQLTKLLPKKFIRCHRSYLINLSEVESFDFEKKIVNQKTHQIPFSEQMIVKLFSESILENYILMNKIF